MATAISDAYFATCLAFSGMQAGNVLSRMSTIAEDCVVRSYVPVAAWADTLAFNHTVRGGTAESEYMQPLVGEARVEDAVLDSLCDFYGLAAGWDGSEAASPNVSAIKQATRFVRALQASGIVIDPALDVDGSVILELENGSLKFKGDGNVIYAFDAGDRGIIAFDGSRISDVLTQAMTA